MKNLRVGVVAGSRVYLPPRKTLWFPWWYMAWSAMRTCVFSLQWQGAKPRTPATTTFSFLHGRRNLSLFSMLFHTWSIWYSSRWRRAKPRTLTWLFIWRFGFWFYLRSTFSEDPQLFAVFITEIYFRSMLLFLLHVKGLSSWWIT